MLDDLHVTTRPNPATSCFFCDFALNDAVIMGEHIGDHFKRGDSTDLPRFLRWLNLAPDEGTTKLKVKFYYEGSE